MEIDYYDEPEFIQIEGVPTCYFCGGRIVECTSTRRENSASAEDMHNFTEKCEHCGRFPESEAYKRDMWKDREPTLAGE